LGNVSTAAAGGGSGHFPGSSRHYPAKRRSPVCYPHNRCVTAPPIFPVLLSGFRGEAYVVLGDAYV
jgi:hypothetical protein